MKKLSLSLKFVIVLGVLALVLFGLSIGAAFASPNRAEQAVDEIGTVTYTVESKEKIDNAIALYDDIGSKTLGESLLFSKSYLSAAKSEELSEKLNQAKKEYVRLAIKSAVVAEQRKYAEKYTDEDIAAFVSAAREATDEYFKDNYDEVETYADLTALEEKYGSLITSESPEEDDNSAPDNSQEEEDIELC